MATETNTGTDAGSATVVAAAKTGATEIAAANTGATNTGATNTGGKTKTGSEAKGGGDAVFPPFETANFASTILWLVITFGALYLIMSRLALPRVKTIIADRHDKIQGDLAAARQMRKEASEAAAGYEKTLAEARANAQALAAETRAKVKLEQENKRQALEADLNGKLQTAEAQIAEAQVAAMANVGQIANDAAAAIVQHFTGRPADPNAIAQAIAQAKA